MNLEIWKMLETRLKTHSKTNYIVKWTQQSLQEYKETKDKLENKTNTQQYNESQKKIEIILKEKVENNNTNKNSIVTN